ncbi:hypothetical protein TPHA_0C00460 [Tetrapisispora phaffii CBS 4417]|uniref:DUF2470 domain-containing protein n=1 Tax=Tetrapisispora phaffii (strain ATCC 24235 / CBS 4417 / NBRC 1672 / NRRL Y-8282 / UCD 70-5) TaxID=1071381 RepID=G8BR27_TETPH|nr:hypothetical protein TPHA_0C00460 [Tetrapisispora phaffii CBS 4417]CCE62203.1 hypothetical protein TPHA_0C00460 [Tetrapisispora phaffii CBS 4417]
MTFDQQDAITAFNANHRLALTDILYFYGHVPITSKITAVRLLSYDLQSMTIRFHHNEVEFDIDKLIVFETPLTQLSDFTVYIDKMVRKAAKERNYSHIQINEVVYPNNIVEYIIIVAVFLPLMCYFYRPLLHLLPLPEFIKEFLDNDFILIAIEALAIITHILETYILLRPKLKFYRVPTDFLIEWYALGLLEGYAPAKRLEQLAMEKLKSE